MWGLLNVFLGRLQLIFSFFSLQFFQFAKMNIRERLRFQLRVKKFQKLVRDLICTPIRKGKKTRSKGRGFRNEDAKLQILKTKYFRAGLDVMMTWDDLVNGVIHGFGSHVGGPW